jgi:hypothetical protein
MPHAFPSVLVSFCFVLIFNNTTNYLAELQRAQDEFNVQRITDTSDAEKYYLKQNMTCCPQLIQNPFCLLFMYNTLDLREKVADWL